MSVCSRPSVCKNRTIQPCRSPSGGDFWMLMPLLRNDENLKSSLCKGLWTLKRFWSVMSSREMFHITTAHSSTKSSASILVQSVPFSFEALWWHSLVYLLAWKATTATKPSLYLHEVWIYVSQSFTSLWHHASYSVTSSLKHSAASCFSRCFAGPLGNHDALLHQFHRAMSCLHFSLFLLCCWK